MARKPLDQLSPSYRARIERGLARGKTRQEARGKRAGEARVRREREIETYGLTTDQMRSIRRYAQSQNNKDIDPDDMIERARDLGYEWFSKYRRGHEALKRQYRRQRRSGSYESLGFGHLEYMAVELDVEDVSWLYYH